MSKTIQLRNVPDAPHRQLKAPAALSGLPLSDYLIREVRKIAEQPTPEQMRERERVAHRGRARRARQSVIVVDASAVLELLPGTERAERVAARVPTLRDDATLPISSTSKWGKRYAHGHRARIEVVV